MIKKIKFDGNFRSDTTIVLQNDDATTDKKTTIKCTELRNKSFTDAMQALLPPLKEMLPLDFDELEDKIDVIGITISRKESQGLGATITLQITLEHFNGPLTLNTPHLHEDASDTGVKAMPWELQEAINELVEEAEAFLKGKRAQEEMEFEDKVRKTAKDHGISKDIADQVIEQHQAIHS